MERLDGDRQRLASPFTGKVASRDMVQFVPFREFTDFGAAAQHALAKHVLAEIPGQFISYMESNGIPPAQRRPAGSVLPMVGAGGAAGEGNSPIPAAGGGGFPQPLGGVGGDATGVFPPNPPQAAGAISDGNGTVFADELPPPYTA